MLNVVVHIVTTEFKQLMCFPHVIIHPVMVPHTHETIHQPRLCRIWQC